MENRTDTIAAISSAMGLSGISIVRISGQEAFVVMQKIYRGVKGKTFEEIKNKQLGYGHIVDVRTGNIIDEVLVSKHRAPYSYTGEDVAEINCHGGQVATQAILQSVLDCGARLAEGGEFTKRAFLNGRIDLVQAEAVMDIIDAKTRASLQAAQNRLKGHLSDELKEIKTYLIDALAYIGVGIEYPEYDVEEAQEEAVFTLLAKAESKLRTLQKNAARGKILNEGLKVAIVGKPNAGKSMLLNALINRERAIVTDIAGTTRDTISEYINIRQIPVLIIDTAGIRSTEDVIEKIGVARSLEAIEEADIVLFVADGSRAWEEQDDEICARLKTKRVIYLINKSDIKIHPSVEERLSNKNLVILSARTKEGLEELEEKIVQEAGFSEEVLTAALSANARQEELIAKAAASLRNGQENLSRGMVVDLVEIDIRDCLESLYQITGQSVGEDIIDRIFANFCLGK